MKILFLTNNPVAHSLADWLKKNACENVIMFEQKLTEQEVSIIKPDWIVSYSYRYMIRPEVLLKLNGKVINLHISLLPWNKGADPNFWSIVNNTPKGVTIHYVDKSLDTGAILLQKSLSFDDEIETIGSSYQKLHRELQLLFQANWDKLKNGTVPSIPQPATGSFHYKKEFESVKHILGNEGWSVTLKELKKRYNNLLLNVAAPN